jgi:hypothetical protein
MALTDPDTWGVGIMTKREIFFIEPTSGNRTKISIGTNEYHPSLEICPFQEAYTDPDDTITIRGPLSTMLARLCSGIVQEPVCHIRAWRTFDRYLETNGRRIYDAARSQARARRVAREFTRELLRRARLRTELETFPRFRSLPQNIFDRIIQESRL